MSELSHYLKIHNALIRNGIPSEVAIEAAEYIASFQIAHLPMSVAVTDLVVAFTEMYLDAGSEAALASLKGTVKL